MSNHLLQMIGIVCGWAFCHLILDGSLLLLGVEALLLTSKMNQSPTRHSLCRMSASLINNPDADSRTNVCDSTTTTRRDMIFQSAFTTATTVLVVPGHVLAEDDTTGVDAVLPSVPPTAAVEKLETQEKNLIVEIKKDEKDEIQAEADTDKLIADLEKKQQLDDNKSLDDDTTSETTTISSSSQTKEQEATSAAETTKQLIDTLEKKEERIEKETLELIQKVESLEEIAETLQQPLLPEPDAKSSAEAIQQSKEETQIFLEQLRERSDEKLDLIAKLKAQSQQRDMDPKTGKYKPMTTKQFEKKRISDEFQVPLSDFDFLKYLKEVEGTDDTFGEILKHFRERLSARFGL